LFILDRICYNVYDKVNIFYNKGSGFLNDNKSSKDKILTAKNQDKLSQAFSKLDSLILYKSINKNWIIRELKRSLEPCKEKKESTASDKSSQLTAELMELSENYGLQGDIWQNYLFSLLIDDLNLFSLAAEKENIKKNSSLYKAAENDAEILSQLFKISFAEIRGSLGADKLNYLDNYLPSQTAQKKNNAFKKGISRSGAELLRNLKDYYKNYGAGQLNKSSAFYWNNSVLKGINNPDLIQFENIVGYQKQKDKLIKNTESFLKGKKAHNVLLYGDSGTGKSSSVKALLNKYNQAGLRLIEIHSEQIKELPEILDFLSARGLFFIIFMDDLSFEEFETEYKYLKAIMEGGIELKPENVLFYATSNRRHIVREKWQDRESEVHKNDILNEKLSLAERFGLTLMYNTPSQQEYLNIVNNIAEQEKMNIKKEILNEKAIEWSQWNNGRSGRSARQFIDQLLKEA